MIASEFYPLFYLLCFLSHESLKILFYFFKSNFLKILFRSLLKLETGNKEGPRIKEATDERLYGEMSLDWAALVH